MRPVRSLLPVLALLSMAACGPAMQQTVDTAAVPEMETVSVETEIPLSQVIFVPNANVNCRLGPTTEHPIVMILTTGQQYPVLGINENADWLNLAAGPSACWAKLSTGEAFGNVEDMPFVEAPAVQSTVLSTPDPVQGEGTSGETGMGLTPVSLEGTNPIIVGEPTKRTCGESTTQDQCEDNLHYLCVWHPSEVACYNVIGCVVLPGYCADYVLFP